MRDTTRSGSNGRLHLHGARNVLCLKSVPIDDPPGATSISETPLNFQRSKGNSIAGFSDIAARPTIDRGSRLSRRTQICRDDYRNELNVMIKKPPSVIGLLMGPWVGVRFLTTRASPNDFRRRKWWWWRDSRGEKKRKNKKEEGKKNVTASEWRIDSLLFATTRIYINRSSDWF